MRSGAAPLPEAEQRRAGPRESGVGVRFARSKQAGLALLLSAQVVGCRCEDEHPYTPFSVTDSLPSDAQPEKTPAEEVPEPSEPARWEAPPGTHEWDVGGKHLVAPSGLVFGTLLRFGGTDLAWLGPETRGSGGDSAGVYRIDENGTLSPFYSVPRFMPRGPDCTLETRSEKAGKSTLALYISARCESPRLAGTPEAAWVFLDVNGASPPFGVRLEQPAAGEALEVKVDGNDADGDGQDDRSIEFLLKSPQGGSGVLTFAWLGRAAGPSRRTETPAQGLTERAQTLSRKAVRKKERAEVPGEVDALRRLFGAVCKEAKRPRVSLLDESRLSCGDLSRPLGMLQMANIDAYLGLSKPFAAIGEVLRAGSIGGAPDRQFETLKAALAKKLPLRSGTQASRIAGTYPDSGWLSFDGASRLWFHTANGEQVVWPAGSEEPSTEPSALDRPRQVTPDPRIGPGGRRALAALPSCDRSEITLVFEAGGVALPPVPTTILAPRPGNCDHFGGAPLAARALEFSGSEAIVLVEGEPVTTSGRPIEFRKPEAWHTRLGLVVASGNTPELWSTDFNWLSQECAVSATRERVACIHDKTITLFTRADAGSVSRNPSP